MSRKFLIKLTLVKTKKLILMKSKTFLILFLFFFLINLIQSKRNYEEEEEELKRSMFPNDFIFGVSTSAYQIEEGYLEDGKGLSNWDVFTHFPGNIKNGENGDFADDHYHRYMEDIENLGNLGVNAYRFSISWTRILPRGRFGEVNPSGVMFYNKIIDNLLLKGIKPFVTIHHFDMPQELEDRYGSWLSPQMQEDFVHFAKICFEKFGDRVKHWVTLNEPNILANRAYMNGTLPPNHCSFPFGNCSSGNSDVEPLIAVHNLLISHAKAVQLYRQQFQDKQGGSIGIVLHAFHYEPYIDDEFGYQAVERSYAFNVAWILDPLIYGEYPALMRKYVGNELPKFSKEEVKLVKQSLDFIGINHYSTLYSVDCFRSFDCTPTENRPIQGFVGNTIYRDGILIGEEMGVFGFYVVPSGMEKVLDYLSMRYPNTSIYITENGYCPPNYQEGSKDMLQDIKRIDFHKSYLAALQKAMRKGAKVEGYFAWSFIDNFEWLEGYSIKFGFYHVDRKTMKRTPRLSAKWYADFISNGEKSITSF